jgi:hypothetical protein
MMVYEQCLGCGRLVPEATGRLSLDGYFFLRDNKTLRTTLKEDYPEFGFFTFCSERCGIEFMDKPITQGQL